MKGPLKTPSNVITTELLSEKGFSEDYDKNFLIAKPNKKEKYLYYSAIADNARSPEVLHSALAELASSEASGPLQKMWVWAKTYSGEGIVRNSLSQIFLLP